MSIPPDGWTHLDPCSGEKRHRQHVSPSSGGYEFVSFTPTDPLVEAVPILLFQSGHGSSAKSHELLLQKIANEGFVVIVPQHVNDTGNHRSCDDPPNKKSATAVFEGTTIAELQTDGTHLAAALDWAKRRKDAIVGGQKVDTGKVVTGGFSAGCVEAICHAADAIPESVSGLVCISPSTAPFVEKAYQFKRSELKEKTKAFTIPTLWITAEEDLCNFETLDMFKDVETKGTTLVSFKDDVLDCSLKLTEEFSIWGAENAAENPGMAIHMALACEEEIVADKPIVSFLKRTFDISVRGEAGPFADESDAVVVTKSEPLTYTMPDLLARIQSSVQM